MCVCVCAYLHTHTCVFDNFHGEHTRFIKKHGFILVHTPFPYMTS